jgi:AcrR family transcriptional regulator
LLAAALEQFVERGYAATRLEDVAKRAGVSKGTLYLYFTNKEELFKAVNRDTIVATIGEAEQDVAVFEAPAAICCALLMRWWDQICATPIAGITKLMLAEGNNFPELVKFHNEEVVARGSA